MANINKHNTKSLFASEPVKKFMDFPKQTIGRRTVNFLRRSIFGGLYTQDVSSEGTSSYIYY